MDILPYVEIDGARTVPDVYLTGCYNQLVEDGTADIVFSRGEVKNSQEFIQLMKHPNNLPLFVVIDKQIKGVAWLNHVSGNYAFGHFAFFKETWGKTKEMGEAIIDYWFSFPGENGPLFDVIVGMVPSKNPRAIRFVEKLGFTQLKPDIPAIYPDCGATILYRQRNG
jgi:hypothetical protein